MSPATPNAIRQAHGPTSAIGSRITDSAYPAPAASASIDAANARAPSGASSIDRDAADDERGVHAGAHEGLRGGEDHEVRRDRAEPTGDAHAEDRAQEDPAPAHAVGEARGHERDQRTEARDREGAAELTVRRVERLRDGIAQLAEQRRGERSDRPGERDGRDQLRLRLVEGARRGERMRTERLGCLGTIDRGVQRLRAPTSARAGSRSGRRVRRTNRRTGSSCRSRRRARRRSRRRWSRG